MVVEQHHVARSDRTESLVLVNFQRNRANIAKSGKVGEDLIVAQVERGHVDGVMSDETYSHFGFGN